jgi:Uma2 family endonuclease
MTVTLLAPPDEIIRRSGISWKTYETLLEELSGAEPDECFYIRNIVAVQGKRRLNMKEDPAPDLIVEIDITSSSQNRLQVYADLRVAEVWIYNGESLVIQQLTNGTYIAVQTSQFFANLSIPDIANWLQRSTTMDYLALVKAFRGGVRSQIGE